PARRCVVVQRREDLRRRADLDDLPDAQARAVSLVWPQTHSPPSPAVSRTFRRSSSAERTPPLEVALGVDQVAVALDVAVLAADHEEHEVLLGGGVRDLARRRG